MTGGYPLHSPAPWLTLTHKPRHSPRGLPVLLAQWGQEIVLVDSAGVIVTGLSTLGAAAETFLSICGPPRYSEIRLNFAQAVQGVETWTRLPDPKGSNGECNGKP
ncbi:hypothetical protein BDW66DRAFT_155455 [Aspergillus desertorum]